MNSPESFDSSGMSSEEMGLMSSQLSGTGLNTPLSDNSSLIGLKKALRTITSSSKRSSEIDNVLPEDSVEGDDYYSTSNNPSFSLNSRFKRDSIDNWILSNQSTNFTPVAFLPSIDNTKNTPPTKTIKLDPLTGTSDTKTSSENTAKIPTTLTAPSALPTGNTLTTSSSFQPKSLLPSVIPIGLNLLSSSDSGTSGDNITNDNTPTFAVDTLTGLRVRLYSDGQLVGQTTINNPKQITTSPLADGVHTITATALDVLGNPLARSKPLSVTIDAALPQLDITTPIESTPLTPGSRLAGTVNGTGTAITSLSYRFNQLNEIPVSINNTTGAFDTELDLTGLDSGVHTLTIITTDLAGNVLTANFEVEVSFDTTPPAIAAALVYDTGTNSSDRITFDPTISGTVTDENEVIDFRAGFDSIETGNFTSILADLQPDSSFTLSQTRLEQIYGGTLPDGLHTLHLQATDRYSNASPVFDVPFTLDTTRPDGNRPPGAIPGEVKTHQELAVSVDLADFVTDPDGDPVNYHVSNPVNGTVQLSDDGKTAVFKPTTGVTGEGSFDLIADDSFGYSNKVTMTVNISDAPLLNLDFSDRDVQINAGENAELVVLGDFADEEDVVLPDSFVSYSSETPEIASINNTGLVTGNAEGVSILKANRDNIQAVTALRVGLLNTPTNDAELNVGIAERYGLDLYPEAVTLTEGSSRQLLVGLNEVPESPDLKAGSIEPIWDLFPAQVIITIWDSDRTG